MDKQFLISSKLYKVGKNGGQFKERLVKGFDDKIVVEKLQIPTKIFKLEFDTKFEILRGENEDESTFEGAELSGFIIITPFQQYKLKGCPKIINEWRNFLAKKINQNKFHHMFRIYKQIGKGSFAQVFFGERVEDNRQFAIKAMSKNALFKQANGKENMINEISIMRQLNHPNLIQLYDVYETQNSVYMAIDLLEGGSLYDLIQKEIVLNPEQVKIIMQQILEGLEYMHSKDIMHRDLKLENILFRDIEFIDSLVICDFGLSTYSKLPKYLFYRCGTPGFVAPEVLNAKDPNTTYDLVCDVYSAGLIFYIILTGKPAFKGKTFDTILESNKAGIIDFDLPIFKKTSDDVKDLLLRMLEINPKKRITSKQCLEHPYFSEFNLKLELNSKTSTFDTFQLEQVSEEDGAQKSPVFLPTTQFNKRKQEGLDTKDKLVMNSPILNGKLSSLEEGNDKLFSTQKVNTPKASCKSKRPDKNFSFNNQKEKKIDSPVSPVKQAQKKSQFLKTTK